MSQEKTIDSGFFENLVELVKELGSKIDVVHTVIPNDNQHTKDLKESIKEDIHFLLAALYLAGKKMK